MSRFIMTALMLLALSSSSAAESWEWDFIASTPPAGRKRGATVIDRGLRTVPPDKTKPCGFLPAEGKKIAPAEAFRFEADFILNKDESDSKDYTLWDSQYVWDNSKKDLRWHKGFAVFLRRSANGYRPCFAFGFGEQSTSVSGPDIVLEPGRSYRLTAEYNGRDSIAVSLGGTEFTRKVTPGGPVAPPAMAPAIGSRSDAHFHPFNGTIERIKIMEIETVEPEKAAAAPKPVPAFPELAGYRLYDAEGQKKTIFFDDFEDGQKSGWRNFHENYQIRRGDGLTGSGALTFTRKAGDPYRFISRPLKLEKGKNYRLSAMCKIEGLADKDGKAVSRTPRALGIEFKKDGKWLSGDYPGPAVVNGECDWTEVVLDFSMPEAADESSLAVFLQNGFVCRQVTWDNILLEERGEAPPVIYPILPKTLRLDKDGLLKFCLYFGSPHNEENLRLFAAYADGKTFSTPVKNGTAEFRLGELPSGRYDLHLKLADTATKRIIAETAFPFVRPAGPKPDYAVEIDESARLTVSGKPFFPVGIFMERPEYLVTPELADTALGNLRDAGFNMVIPYHSLSMKIPDNQGSTGTAALRKSLDTFQRYGLKVMPSLLQLTGSMRHDIKLFDGLADKDDITTQLISGIKDHPALLGYYITDEEPVGKLDAPLKLRFRLSELDPYHPAATLTNLPTNYPFFSPTGDFLMIDKYPIYTEKDQSMGQIRECFEIRQQNCRLGQWFVPQCFNWGIYQRNRPYEEFRYPTELEMRSQCLLALNFRSRGIVFYAYESVFTHQERRDPGSSKWFWPRVANVIKLLNGLEKFFLADQEPRPVKLTSTGASKVEAKLHTANDGSRIVLITSDGPGEGRAVIDTGITGLKSRFGFTRELGSGKYEFTANNIASDILE